MSRSAEKGKQRPWGFRSFLRSCSAAILVLIFFWAAREADRLPAGRVSLPQEGELALHMIDVGQGQALLLTCNGAAAMVDAGLSGPAGEMIAYVRSQGVDRLDYLFVTHPHQDHCGGAKKLLAAIPTQTLTVPDYFAEEALLATAGEWIGTTNTQIDIAGAGREYDLGGAVITVLHPPMDNDIDDMNQLSLVLKVDFDGRTLLLTGDIPRSVEEELLPVGHIDLLQSPHHGSGGSNSAAFLADLSPDYVFISCGLDNDYGHPHPEALSRMEAAGAQIWRTDLRGTVVCRVSEGELKISSEK